MTKSMTAFARVQKNLAEGDLIWELRSVNNRFLELYLKMPRSEEHTSELQSPDHLVCRLLLEKKKNIQYKNKNSHRQ